MGRNHGTGPRCVVVLRRARESDRPHLRPERPGCGGVFRPWMSRLLQPSLADYP